MGLLLRGKRRPSVVMHRHTQRMATWPNAALIRLANHSLTGVASGTVHVASMAPACLMPMRQVRVATAVAIEACHGFKRTDF